MVWVFSWDFPSGKLGIAHSLSGPPDFCFGAVLSQCRGGKSRQAVSRHGCVSMHRLHILVFPGGLWTVNPAWSKCGSMLRTLMGLRAAPWNGLEGRHTHTMCRADLPQDRCLLEFLEVSRAKDDPSLLFFPLSECLF